MLEGPALSRLHAAAAAAKAAGTDSEAQLGMEQQQQQQQQQQQNLLAASSTADQSQVADASNMMVSQSKGTRRKGSPRATAGKAVQDVPLPGT
eukprot:1161277-Pelagomonas_calceolata.AAC.9